MTYDEFVSEYNRLVKLLLLPGSEGISEKLGKLVDEYPDYEKDLDEENDKNKIPAGFFYDVMTGTFG